MTFYDVKTRSNVDVPDGSVKTQKFETTTKTGKTQVRYQLTAEHGGRKLFKFVNEETYKKHGGK
ncbi:MAG: hypothetical protein KIT45_00240 [Fimbriimonadia bacterium]|nr:hypothetical protein [Fimbriimonadia bacterium]